MILLINVPLHVDVISVSLELPVEDHMLSWCQGANEHIILWTHPYVGLTTFFAVQRDFAVSRCHHPREHLAVRENANFVRYQCNTSDLLYLVYHILEKKKNIQCNV